MGEFGHVVAVVDRPLGTTLALPASIGDGVITVDDISKLTWPAGGLRIGSEGFIYSVDAAPDQDVALIDLDEDQEGYDEEGTLTLGGRLLKADYDVDEPVIQFQQSEVKERIATVLLPDQAEELVLRVPRGLWDRLPTDIRQRDGAPETVALEKVGGEWVMTDVIAEDPSVDASYIDTLTLPTSIEKEAGSGADAFFFDEPWSNPGRIVNSDNSWATATGSSSTPTTTPHNTGFQAPGTAADDASSGTIAWAGVNAAALAKGGDIVYTSAAFAQSHKLKVTGFGLSVPAGATITGITVEVSRAALVNFVYDLHLQLLKGGVAVGTDKASPAKWPLSIGEYQSVTYGGDLWGTTWTPAQVNDPDFGMYLQVQFSNGWAQVDAIRIKVNYTTTSATDRRSDTHYLKALNFGFGIPDEATIVGVTVAIERHASANSDDDYAIDNTLTLNDGTIGSDERAGPARWPTVDTVAIYGGDLWGMELTPDIVNGATFGVLLSVNVNNGVTVSIDLISMTIAYVLVGDA